MSNKVYRTRYSNMTAKERDPEESGYNTVANVHGGYIPSLDFHDAVEKAKTEDETVAASSGREQSHKLEGRIETDFSALEQEPSNVSF